MPLILDEGTDTEHIMNSNRHPEHYEAWLREESRTPEEARRCLNSLIYHQTSMGSMMKIIERAR